MELEEGFPRFSNVRYNAFWSHAHLDTRLDWDAGSAHYTISHLKDCQKNPMVGLLARREAQGKHINYPYHYGTNVNMMLRHKKIASLNDSFNSQLQKSYPKTFKARMFLIENQSVVLRTVKKHTSGLKKLMYRLFVK